MVYEHDDLHEDKQRMAVTHWPNDTVIVWVEEEAVLKRARKIWKGQQGKKGRRVEWISNLPAEEWSNCDAVLPSYWFVYRKGIPSRPLDLRGVDLRKQ